MNLRAFDRNMRGLPRLRFLALFAVLAFASVAAPAAADGFVINRVEVDDPAGQIDIFGTGFGADQPVVTLEGIPVVVVSHTATEIVVTMPAGTVPGTYLLTVSQVPSGPFGGGASSDFYVTVGAEGPQGPQGVPGPAGPTGPQGPPGPGSVTSVGSGAGLTGGPITGAGSLSIATGGVTSGMIANGAVGAAQINTAQVQTRLLASCPLGEYLRGVNADGSVLCGTFNVPPLATTARQASSIPFLILFQNRSSALPPITAILAASAAGTKAAIDAVAASIVRNFFILLPPNVRHHDEFLNFSHTFLTFMRSTFLA